MLQERGDGLTVVKHGGRAVSSQCGSVDVAEALQLPLCRSKADVQDRAQLAASSPFLFLQAGCFNIVPPHVMALRRQLGLRTCFNVLNPLLNPIQLSHQVMGVYDPSLLVVVPELASSTGVCSLMVVHGFDGLDEVSLSAPTDIVHVRDGVKKRYTISPESVGLRSASLAAIHGGDAQYNAALITSIFSGLQGPYRDVVLLNAAAGFVAADQAEDFVAGVRLAAQCIDSGCALTFLKALQKESVQ